MQVHILKKSLYFFYTVLIFFSSSDAVPWQSPCAPERRRVLANILDQDKVVKADSMFSVLESECSLDAFDLLKWMRVKGILTQFSEAGRIACLISLKQPDFASMLQNQLTDIIKESSVDTIRAVLKDYSLCVLSTSHPDTSAMRRWLSETYFRFGLYDEELSVLEEIDSKPNSSIHDLLAAARRHFSFKRFNRAIRIALLAYYRVSDAMTKSLCAQMLYQSYAQTGKMDSAVIWLQQVPLTQPGLKAQAITFYQRTGYASRVDSMLSDLPRSFTRDTLVIRQKIFASDFDGAALSASKLLRTCASKQEKSELFLWRIRALLFSGNVSEAAVLMDSMEFSPDMNYAGEFLSYKYASAVMAKSGGPALIFGAVAYASWLVRPEMAYRALQSSGLDSCNPDVRQMILLVGVKTLLAGNMFEQARTVMERINLSLACPEFYYYYGEVLFNTGRTESGKKVLEELLLKHPKDVFSEKARIFLSTHDAP